MSDEEDGDDNGGGSIVGTSSALEKPYLRLTERPVPSSVRPVSVLKQSLALMCRKKKEGASWTGYLGEQMKSIRQDLVIQAVADDFALEVYETNARWCLENNDIAEFKRCLLRIEEFYKHLDITSAHMDEFYCYFLLYYLLSEDFPALNTELAQLRGDRRTHKAIQHAIKICEAYIDNNWRTFFKLSNHTYFLEKHLLDIASERLRINALKSILVSYVSTCFPKSPPYAHILTLLCSSSCSYRPTVPLEWLASQLALTPKSAALEWLSTHDCVFSDLKTKSDVDSKDSLKGLLEWEEKNRPGK